MLLRSILKSRLTAFAMAWLVVMVVQMSAAAQCETASDQKMVSDMYAKIKADRTLAGQIRHINVSSLNLVIKLQGYTMKKTEYDRLVGIALKMPCVKMVNSSELASTAPDTSTGGTNQRLASGGCATGTKQCGDICIPEADTCNIDAYLGLNYDPIRFWDLLASNSTGYLALSPCEMP